MAWGSQGRFCSSLGLESEKGGKKTIPNAACTSLKKTFHLHRLSLHLRRQQCVRTGPWPPPEQRFMVQKENNTNPTDNPPHTHNLDRDLLSLPIKTLISIPFSPKPPPTLQCCGCPLSMLPLSSREGKDVSSSSAGFPALGSHHQLLFWANWASEASPVLCLFKVGFPTLWIPLGLL